MKRNELVNRLINEGFSEKTLVNFSDKQLANLSERIFNEQEDGEVEAGPDADPDTIAAVANAGAKVKMGEANESEEKSKGKGCKICKMSPCKCTKDKKTNVKENLKGNQKKIDANHNGKVDKQDFEILRNKKTKTKETTEGNKFSGELEKAKEQGKKSFEINGEKIDVKENGKKWIQNAINPENKGKLHRKLGVPKDEKIPASKLNAAAKEKGTIGKEARLAKTLKGLHESNNSDVMVTRNLQFELKEAGVTDKDLETYDINELAQKHHNNPYVKDAHDLYKRIVNKTMDFSKQKAPLPMNEWVQDLAEKKLFHTFTSKSEIMEMIKTKINESETMQPMPSSKPKKGHNGIPEFMSYDAITKKKLPSKAEVKEQGTKTAPAKPKVNPGTKPKTPNKPFNPNTPKVNPKPKALKEKEI